MNTLESMDCFGVRVGAAEVRLVAPTGLLAAAPPTGLLTGLMVMVCLPWSREDVEARVGAGAHQR
ncbi:hypothetical protein, partial [Sinomonas sp. G460-2]|uniref:hypothetical protein n=1 Tax=Sinomonas sp. G460-2 TaxID=3393464 RepID=UPI0039EE3A52